MSNIDENLKKRIARINAGKTNQKESVPEKIVHSQFKDCEKCGGTLYTKNGQPCSCKTDFVLSKALIGCNVGQNFLRVNLDYYLKEFSDSTIRLKKGLNGKYLKKSFGINYLIDFIKLYASTFDNRLLDGRGFILCGNCGGGKTSAAIWVIKRLCLRNYKKQFDAERTKPYTMLFFEAQKILDMIKDTWDNDSPTKHESKHKLGLIEKVDYLVIDDLGAEYSNSWDWIISIFLKFIKGRANQNKPTVITMNYTPEQMSARFNESDFPRLSSILTEKFEVFVIDNPCDIRTKIAEKTNLFDVMTKEVGR